MIKQLIDRAVRRLGNSPFVASWNFCRLVLIKDGAGFVFKSTRHAALNYDPPTSFVSEPPSTEKNQSSHTSEKLSASGSQEAPWDILASRKTLKDESEVVRGGFRLNKAFKLPPYHTPLTEDQLQMHRQRAKFFLDKILSSAVSGDMSTSLSFFKAARDSELVPCQPIFYYLAGLCTRFFKIEHARSIIDDFIHSGYESNEVIWRLLMHFALKSKFHHSSIKAIDTANCILNAMSRTGVQPRYRTFVPIIEMLGSIEDLDGLFTLQRIMFSYGVRPREPFFITLISICHRRGSLDQLDSAFQGLSRCVYFPSEEGSAQIAEILGNGIKRSVVNSKTCRCSCCEAKLEHIGLTSTERMRLRNGVMLKASQGGVQSVLALASFSTYIKEMGNNVPTVIVDGPNVAYDGQNFMEGAFSYEQIDAVVQKLKEDGERVLLVMPQHYLEHRITAHVFRSIRRKYGQAMGPYKTPVSSRDSDIVSRWLDEDIVYACPVRAYDDLFWMYATVGINDIDATDRGSNLDASVGTTKNFTMDKFDRNCYSDANVNTVICNNSVGRRDHLDTVSSTKYTDFSSKTSDVTFPNSSSACEDSRRESSRTNFESDWCSSQKDVECQRRGLTRWRVLTNDQMRDHISNLNLPSRQLDRWRNSQILGFSIYRTVGKNNSVDYEVNIKYPSEFSWEMQKIRGLDGQFYWHIPLGPKKEGQEWLCVPISQNQKRVH